MATESNIQDYEQKIQTLQSSVDGIKRLASEYQDKASEYQAKVTQSSAQLKEALQQPIGALTRQFNDLANAALDVANAEEDKAKQLAGAEDVLSQCLAKASTCAQEVEKSLNLVLETVETAYGNIGKLEDLIRDAKGKTKGELGRLPGLQSDIKKLADTISTLCAQAEKERREAEDREKKAEQDVKKHHDSYAKLWILKKAVERVSDAFFGRGLLQKERDARDCASKAGVDAKHAKDDQQRAQSELDSLSPLSSQLVDIQSQFNACGTTLRDDLDSAEKVRSFVKQLQKAVGSAQNAAGVIQHESNARNIAESVLELQNLFNAAEDQACIDSAWDQRPREIEQGLALVVQKLKERESQDF